MPDGEVEWAELQPVGVLSPDTDVAKLSLEGIQDHGERGNAGQFLCARGPAGV